MPGVRTIESVPSKVLLPMWGHLKARNAEPFLAVGQLHSGIDEGANLWALDRHTANRPLQY